MRVSVLASGSSGNATFIQMGETKLLVDAGISARRIKNSLAEIGVAIEELQGILITHEHRDHINGLVTLTKKYQLPIYSRANTFRQMYCRDLLADRCCNAIVDCLAIGDIRIESFSISHDAADPVGYSLYRQGLKCTVATDLGFVTTGVQKALDDSDVVVLEANHDVDLLQQNPAYPQTLKQRILSNRGHLSKQDAAWALVKMRKKKHCKVLLAHLSDENNKPDLAYDTICKIVSKQGCDLIGSMDIKVTKPDETVSLDDKYNLRSEGVG